MSEHSKAGYWVPATDPLHTPFSTVAISIEKGRELEPPDWELQRRSCALKELCCEEM